MDEFLILHCNRNYYISWLNEDLVRIIYFYHLDPEPEPDYPDLSDDFNEFYDIYKRRHEECILDYIKGNYYYFYVIDYHKRSFYYDDYEQDKKTYFSVNSNNLPKSYRINARMNTTDLIRLFQEKMIIKECWI